LSILDQLAIITKVRQEMANPEKPPEITELLKETNILQMIS